MLTCNDFGRLIVADVATSNFRHREGPNWNGHAGPSGEDRAILHLGMEAGVDLSDSFQSILQYHQRVSAR